MRIHGWSRSVYCSVEIGKNDLILIYATTLGIEPMSTASNDRSSRVFEVTHTDQEWRQLLTPEQYSVLRGHATERAGTCALLHEERKGTFTCAGCRQPLFVATTKFDSGTGWPSFNTPEPGAIGTSTDDSFGMLRTEVHCSRCGSHLGHVFPDGPPPTGLRYCINGIAMNFVPEPTA